MSIKKVILFNGPSCAGKTTISTNLWKTQNNSALIMLDEIRWLYSDYVARRDFSLELASEVAVEMAKKYLQKGVDVIVDKAFLNREYILPFLSLKQDYDVQVIQINIEAPFDVLLARAKTRPYHTKKESNVPTTSTLISKTYNNYKSNLYPVDVTYDSSLQNETKIVEDIRSRFF